MALTLTQQSADPCLSKIATATTMRLLSGSTVPVDRAEAISRTLGSATVTSGDFSAITTYGSNEGRSITGPVVATFAMTATGSGLLMSLDDGSDLLHVSDVTGGAVSVTNGETRQVSYGFVRIPFVGSAS